ncbi:MAG: insulinase family protein [Myxococcales bacterium]|nr:insulinase family protein [Myxococcales bacterium]
MWIVWAVPTFAGIPPLPPSPLDFRPPTVETKELCFPSGLRLQLARLDTGGAIALTSVLETERPSADPPGTQRLVQHLSLFGARAPEGGSWLDRLAGVQLDGFTHPDATVTVTIGGADDLDRLLAVEASRLASPLRGVTPADVQHEWSAIASEGALSDHGDGSVLRALRQQLYAPSHPYLQSEDSVDVPPSLEDLQQWTARQYRTEQLTLRIEGDLATLDGTFWSERMTSAFGPDILTGTSTHCDVSPPATQLGPPRSTDPVELHARVPHRTLVVGWSLPPAHAENLDWMQQVTDLLNAYDDRCSLRPGRHTTELVCRTQVHADDDEHLVRSLMGLRNGPAGTLNAAGPVFFGSFVRDASAFTNSLFATDPFGPRSLAQRALWGHFTGQLDLVGRVTVLGRSPLEDDRAQVERWLGPERAAVVLVIPEMARGSTPHPLPSHPSFDTPAPEHRWAPGTLEPSRLSKSVLDNGIETWVLGTTTSPGATTSLVFPRGANREATPAAHEVLRRLASLALPRGGGVAMIEMGVRADKTLGRRTTRVESRGAANALAHMLWRSRAGLEGLEMDFSGRQNALDFSASSMHRDFEGIVGSVRRRHLLGSHPWGRPWWETSIAARQAPSGKVWRWARSVFHPQDARLVIVGNVTPDVVSKQTDRYLSGYRSKKPPVVPQAPPLFSPPARQILAIDRPGPLTDVHVECRLPGRTSATDAALDVLEDLLQRGAWRTFRASAAAREVVRLEDEDDALSLLSLSISVHPSQAEQTVSLMLELLAAVREGLPDDLVQTARQHTAGAWGRQWTSVGSATAALVRAAESSLTADEVLAWPERLATVDATALATLLEDCVGHESVTVVGPDPSGAGWTPFDAQALADDVENRLQ